MGNASGNAQSSHHIVSEVGGWNIQDQLQIHVEAKCDKQRSELAMVFSVLFNLPLALAMAGKTWGEVSEAQV